MEPLVPLQGDDERKRRKITHLNDRLQQWVRLGRVHPHYSLANGRYLRVATRHPNLAAYRFSLVGSNDSHVLRIGPRYLEVIAATHRTNPSLARRIAQYGWSAFGFHEQDERWVKVVVFSTVYGVDVDKYIGHVEVERGALTKEMFLDLYPSFNWCKQHTERERHLVRTTGIMTNAMLDVAVAVEANWVGLLTAVGIDELFLEGQYLQRYVPHIETIWREQLQEAYPDVEFSFAKEYNGRAYHREVVRDRIAVLMEDD